MVINILLLSGNLGLNRDNHYLIIEDLSTSGGKKTKRRKLTKRRHTKRRRAGSKKQKISK